MKTQCKALTPFVCDGNRFRCIRLEGHEGTHEAFYDGDKPAFWNDKERDEIEALLNGNTHLVGRALRSLGAEGDGECESAAWGALWDAAKNWRPVGGGRGSFAVFARTLIITRVRGIQARRRARLKRERPN